MSQWKKNSKEFKIDAINLVKEQGYSCSEASKSLDIPYELLNRWIRGRKKSDENEAFRGNGKLTAEQLEIRQLKKENRRLKMEKELIDRMKKISESSHFSYGSRRKTRRLKKI